MNESSNSNIDNVMFKARVSDGIFFNLFLNLFVFFLEKSYHSNWVIKSILDHLWPNGFKYHIDQPRNCPLGFPDDR